MSRYKVIIAGAGMSGICAAVHLQKAGIDSFLILEKRDSVGGTWRDNRYPGVACDVPSHLYSFSFAPKPDWTKMYAPGEEIWSYLKDCTTKFNLHEKIKFNTSVKSIIFKDDGWHVTTNSGKVYIADHVVSGLGGLHTPNFPMIAGQDSFNGVQFHTAEWPRECELSGKRVAVIGTGATSVQLVPEIAKKVAKLTVFQRSPIWVLPKNNPCYSDEEKQEFFASLQKIKAHRLDIWQEWEEFSVEVVRPTALNLHLQKLAKESIERAVRDPETVAKLTPDYRYGCKRPTLSNDYYAAFDRDNVELVVEPIKLMNQSGIQSVDGKLRSFDIIIFATGFKAYDITNSVHVEGLEGANLKDAWSERIAAHRSVMVPGFPNFFILLGPGSSGLTSALEMIEAQSNYLVKFIKYLDDHGFRYMHPTFEALDDWIELLKAGLGETVMNAGCKSWWTDEDGYNHTTWPYSSRRFRQEVGSLRADEFVAA